ncbi:EthD family reductase, partial [Undibacterium sp.]|uniref:EthD family reductase n=1 Tax=Undibacterium sp. TaxID=1914977 RepID=UPI002B9434BE
HNNEETNAMAKLFAIYRQPADPAKFDDYYFNKHVPLAKTIPGLRSYEVSSGDVMGMSGKHAVYLVAALTFDSMEAIGAAMASPQGAATAADLANFAAAGVDIMFSETRMV